MLVAKIEIHPFGDSTKAKEISTIYIGNVGTVQEDYALMRKKCKYAIFLNYNPALDDAENRREPVGTLEHWRHEGAEVLVAKAIDLLKANGKV